MTRRRKLMVSAGAVIAVGIGTAFAVASGSNGISTGPGVPINFAGSVQTVQPLSSDQATDLAAMAEGVPGISNVATSPTSVSGSPGTSLSLDMAVPALGGAAAAAATWKAAVFVGAVADRYVASGLPRVSDVGVTLVAPDGQRDPIGGGVGNVVPGQHFADFTAAASATILANAKSFGFTNVDIQTIRGIQDALFISARSSDPVAALSRLRATGNALTALLGVAPTTFEGVYFQIQDASGEPQYGEGTAARDGAAFAWASPTSGIRVGDMIPVTSQAAANR